MDSFLGHQGLDLLVRSALGSVRKRLQSIGFGTTSNQQKRIKYLNLEMELLKIFKFILSELGGINAFFDEPTHYLKSLLAGYWPVNGEAGKYIVDSLLYLSNLNEYPELLVNVLLREDETCLAEMMTFLGLLVDNLDENVTVITCFVEFVNNLCKSCKLEKRFLFRRALSNNGFDKLLSTMNNHNNESMKIEIDKFTKQIQLDLSVMRESSNQNLQQLLGTNPGEKSLEKLVENIQLFSQLDPYYLGILEKASRIIVLNGQGILPSIQETFGISVENEQEVFSLQNKLASLEQNYTLKIKDFEASKNYSNKELERIKASAIAEEEKIKHDASMEVENIRKTADAEKQKANKEIDQLTKEIERLNLINTGDKETQIKLQMKQESLVTTVKMTVLELKKDCEKFKIGFDGHQLGIEKYSEDAKAKLKNEMKSLLTKLQMAAEKEKFDKKNEPTHSDSSNALVEANSQPSISSESKDEKIAESQSKQSFSPKAIPLPPPPFALKPKPKPIVYLTPDVFPKQPQFYLKNVRVIRLDRKYISKSLWPKLNYKENVKYIDLDNLQEIFETSPPKELTPISIQSKLFILSPQKKQSILILFGSKISPEVILKGIEDMEFKVFDDTFLSQLASRYPEEKLAEKFKIAFSEIDKYEMPDTFFIRLSQLSNPRERVQLLNCYGEILELLPNCRHFTVLCEQFFNALVTSEYLKTALSVILLVSNYLDLYPKGLILNDSASLGSLHFFLNFKNTPSSTMSDLIAEILLKKDASFPIQNESLYQMCKQLEANSKYKPSNLIEKTVSSHITKLQDDSSLSSNENFKQICSFFKETQAYLLESESTINNLAEKCYEYFGYFDIDSKQNEPQNGKEKQSNQDTKIDSFFKVLLTFFRNLTKSFVNLVVEVDLSNEVSDLSESSVTPDNKQLEYSYNETDWSKSNTDDSYTLADCSKSNTKNSFDEANCSKSNTKNSFDVTDCNNLFEKVENGSTSLQIIEESLNVTDKILEEVLKRKNEQLTINN